MNKRDVTAAFGHRDVSPPGWSGTTEAMKKHPEIDNPFALAWSMYNKGETSHDDLGAEDFEHETPGEPPGAPEMPAPPNVPGTTPQQKGHTGMANTYGQKRGASPDPSGPNAIARAGVGYELADDDRHSDDDDAHRALDVLDDDDGEMSGEPVAGSPALRGHAVYGSAGHGDDKHTDDDDTYDDDADFASVAAQVSEEGHEGSGGFVVGQSGVDTHGDDAEECDDDDDDRHSDDDDKHADDLGESPPGSDIATKLQAEQAASEEEEEAEELYEGSTPAPTDPRVSGTPGMPKGIANPKVVGWE